MTSSLNTLYYASTNGTVYALSVASFATSAPAPLPTYAPGSPTSTPYGGGPVKYPNSNFTGGEANSSTSQSGSASGNGTSGSSGSSSPSGAAGANNSKSGPNLGVVLGVTFGALALVGLVSAVVMSQKRKSSEPRNDEEFDVFATPRTPTKAANKMEDDNNTPPVSPDSPIHAQTLEVGQMPIENSDPSEAGFEVGLNPSIAKSTSEDESRPTDSLLRNLSDTFHRFARIGTNRAGPVTDESIDAPDDEV